MRRLRCLDELQQGAFDVTGSVEHSDDFDPVTRDPIKNHDVFETRNAREPATLRLRMAVTNFWRRFPGSAVTARRLLHKPLGIDHPGSLRPANRGIPLDQAGRSATPMLKIVAKVVPILGIDRYRVSAVQPFHQELFQVILSAFVLIAANDVANVFTGTAIAHSLDLFVDERLHWLRQGDVHRSGHSFTLPAMASPVKGRLESGEC